MKEEQTLQTIEKRLDKLEHEYSELAEKLEKLRTNTKAMFALILDILGIKIDSQSK